LQLPLTDAIQIPTYSRFIRDILNKKKKVLKSVVVVMNYPRVERLPTKVDDAGIPMITCSIGKAIIRNALCDLGVRVSAVSFSLYKKLDLHDYIPTAITLQMADSQQMSKGRNLATLFLKDFLHEEHNLQLRLVNFISHENIKVKSKNS
jgi:hypothetical protein